MKISVLSCYKERFEDFWEKIMAKRNEEKIIEKTLLEFTQECSTTISVKMASVFTTIP
jgi:hypothetical protein